MKKYAILVMMLLGTLSAGFAQDGSTQSAGSGKANYSPVAGDISGAVLFGRGNFLDIGYQELIPNAGTNTGWTVPGTAPYANVVETNSNSVSNIVGAEVRYFLLDNIALKLSGGAILRNTPARSNLPSVIDASAPNSAWVPAYGATENDKRTDLNLNLGGEYHFSSKYSRLFPYAGVTIPFYFARRTQYNPTIIYNQGSNTDEPYMLDAGARIVQTFGFGAQVVGGVDYYLMEGLYFGFELKPVSYLYAFNNKFPAPGLENRKADTHTVSFFSQTFLKIGFRF